MPSTISFRLASESDIPAMAAIRAISWGAHEYWCERIKGYMDCTHHPQKALTLRTIFVAEEGAHVIGLVAGHLTRRFDCDGELEWIDVAPERRRSGVASELLRKIAAWFAENDAKRVCVDVTPENTIARSFYRRHGAVELNAHWLLWLDISAAMNEQ